MSDRRSTCRPRRDEPDLTSAAIRVRGRRGRTAPPRLRPSRSDRVQVAAAPHVSTPRVGPIQRPHFAGRVRRRRSPTVRSHSRRCDLSHCGLGRPRIPGQPRLINVFPIDQADKRQGRSHYRNPGQLRAIYAVTVGSGAGVFCSSMLIDLRDKLAMIAGGQAGP